MYGKLLEQKKEAYDKGVQKIDNTITQVASLPVYREADKKHLRDLVEGITTELNQQHGADWSDQHLNNITSKHISAIANDPTVQQAVSSTLQYKADYQKQQDDYETNGEKAMYNAEYWHQGAQPWLNSSEPGTKYTGQYVGYSDVDKVLGEAFKAKHPNTRISVKSAGYYTDPITHEQKFSPKLAMQQWDVEEHKWKGVSAQDVENEVSGILQGRPDLQKQLQINAWGTYRGATPESVVDAKMSVLQNKKELLTRHLEDIDEKYGSLSSDDPMYKKYKKERELTQHTIENEIDPNLTATAKYNALAKYHADPSILEQEKQNTYMTSWYNAQIKKYAYGEELLDYKGQSPTEKQHWQADHGLKVQQLILAQKKDAREEQKLKDSEAKARYLQNKQSEDFVTQQGLIIDKRDPLAVFTDTKDKARVEINNKKDNYLYNTYHNQFPDYFHEGIPTDNGKTQLEKLYTKRYEAYKNGNGLDDKGQPVSMEQRDIDFFKDIDGANRVSIAMQDKLTETDNAWKKAFSTELAKKPEIQKYNQLYQQNPEAVSRKTADATMLFDKLLHMYNTEGYTEATSQKANAIARQYGFHNYSEVEHLVNAHREFANAYRKVAKEEAKWKGEYLKSNDYLVNPQSTQWVNKALKNPQIDKVIVDKAIKLIPAGQKSKILDDHSDGKGVDISYVQNPLSGEYTMQVVGADKNKVETFPIAPNDVPSEWTNYKDESTIAQLLRVNRDPYSNISTTYGKGGKSFKNAEDLGTIMDNNVPTNIRYGVIKEGGKYTVEFWAKPKGAKEAHLVKDPVTGMPLQGSSTSIKAIENMIQNYSQTRSLNPVGYTQYSETEEESTTTNEE